MSKKSKKAKTVKFNRMPLESVIEDDFETDASVDEDEADTEGSRCQKLYWPTYSYALIGGNAIVENDMDYFPGIKKINSSFSCMRNWCGRRDREGLQRTGEFWRCFFMSQEAYIVDRFFSVDEYESLIDSMCEPYRFPLHTVSILCLNHFDEVQTRNRARKGKETGIQVIVEIFHMKKSEGTIFEIHDRFVLLDNKIWHFGGTIGGVNRHLTAYSGGWTDCDGLFKKYLKEIITKRQ